MHALILNPCNHRLVAKSTYWQPHFDAVDKIGLVQKMRTKHNTSASLNATIPSKNGTEAEENECDKTELNDSINSGDTNEQDKDMEREAERDRQRAREKEKERLRAEKRKKEKRKRKLVFIPRVSELTPS